MAKIFRAAKAGYDIFTAAKKDLTFDSGLQCLLEHASANVNLATSSGAKNQNIAHSLGYYPAHWGFVRDPNNTGRWYPANGIILIDYDFQSYFQNWLPGESYYQESARLKMYVTTSNLNVDIYDSEEDSKTYVFQYIIFANQADNAIGTGNDNVSGNLIITKPGIDKDSALDARQVLFMSGSNVQKIDPALSGTATLNLAAATIDYNRLGYVVVNHNLGYVPRVYARCDVGLLPYEQFQQYVGTTIITYFITSTQIVFVGINPELSAQSFSLSYNILRDKIA